MNTPQLCQIGTALWTGSGWCTLILVYINIMCLDSPLSGPHLANFLLSHGLNKSLSCDYFTLYS